MEGIGRASELQLWCPWYKSQLTWFEFPSPSNVECGHGNNTSSWGRGRDWKSSLQKIELSLEHGTSQVNENSRFLKLLSPALFLSKDRKAGGGVKVIFPIYEVTSPGVVMS